MTRRVVVTGLGTVNPLGLDLESTWEALAAGQSGIARITAFDPEAAGIETHFAGEVRGFDPALYMDRKEARRMDRFMQFAVAASRQALDASGLQIDPHNCDRVGVVIGTGIGGLITLLDQHKVLLERGPSRISPFLVPMMITNMASGQVSIDTGARGPNYCVTSACSSSADSIGEAFEIIRRGDADAMIAGGSEAEMTPLAFAGFNQARALSTRNDAPEQASRPFDKDRDGFVMSEGAATLILEELEFARQRGAPILAELVGYGLAADAYHITLPAEGGEGAVRAMRMALRKAELEPEQVDYVNAHGTSTPAGDPVEVGAIRQLVGEEGAARVMVSSTKSMHGHGMGAAGGFEAVLTALAVREGVVPPTINVARLDEACAGVDHVLGTPRRGPVRLALSNSFGFGGHNAVLAFAALERAA